MHRNSLTVSSPLDMLPPRAQALLLQVGANQAPGRPDAHFSTCCSSCDSCATTTWAFSCSRPPLARMLASSLLQPAGAPAFASPPCGRHSHGQLTSDARFRAQLAGSDAKQGSHGIFVVKTRQFRCVRLQPLPASPQRSSPALALQIAHARRICV